MSARLLPFAALLLGGCAVLEPHYKRPALPTPAAWPTGPAYDAATQVAGEPALPAWRDFFTDPKLNQLIETALQNNRNLRVSALNIERARSLYRIQRAARVPAIDATAGGQIQRGVAVPGSDTITRAYTAGASVTAFEVDFLGRVRGLSRSALQSYLATRDARDAAQISLIAEVATAYLAYAGDLELLRLAQDTLKTQRESYDLTQRRFEAGASSQVAVFQAQTTVETARADVARYTAQTAQDENALELLLGAPMPDALRPTTVDAIAFGAAELPPGLPSEVLLSRPDIRESEHRLRGANADVGAARAAFFPSVHISAFGGSADPRFENLFSGANGAWSFTPSVNIPIFRGGQLIGQLGAANASRKIAVAQYEKAVQAAFREVADALADRAALGERLAALQALAGAADQSFKLSDARYREGVDNYLNLLDAQRALYAAQQNLVSARVARAANFVALYKTLGGGGR
ncbi:MAG: efflux transporter outer membrane subunit [Hyphomonadaceae bacterium]